MASLAIVTATVAVPGSVGAQPAEPGDVLEQHVEVSPKFGQPSLTPTDVFKLVVDTTISAPAEYFEVRVRIWRPDGSLFYQKTEPRNDIEAGAVSVGFERELADLGVSPGRYPVEVRVLASGSEPTVVTSRILVVEQDMPPLPVVVIARLSSSPALDPSGRFALDPATHSVTREAADDLVALASGRSESLTIAIPPLLLEEWSSAASGYSLSGAAGVQDVPAENEVPQQYRDSLESLARAVETERVELLDVPYAEPDIGGLQTIGALDDLARHYAIGAATYLAALGAEASAGTCVCGDIVSSPAAELMADAGHAYFICAPESSDTTISPGVYRESSTGTVALVMDRGLASVLTTGTAEDIYDHLYDTALSEDPPSALVVVLDIGPGRPHDAEDVSRLLALVDRVDWLEAAPAARAAELTRQGPITLVQEVPAPVDAPRGYWDDIADAREGALALAEAWGADEPDSSAALRAALISESASWKGPDGSYPFADRGMAFAASVTRLAEDTFGAVSLEVRDVTLAARAGDVPLTIFSAADRSLTLRVETIARSSQPRTTEASVTINPADNFLTIPVDLGSAVSDELTVRVMAGNVLVAETTVTVRASYLDRLTTMVMVVVVLLVLLLFIRRRVKRADAGNMPVEADKDEK